MTDPTAQDFGRIRPLTIGVLSDTHIPHRMAQMPDKVYAALRGCDVILHAGDLEDPGILPALEQIAPVHAVRGNLHWQYALGTHDQALPSELTLALGGRTIWMTHGHINFGYSVLDKFIHYKRPHKLAAINDYIVNRLHRARPAGADVVVFGHSHKVCAQTRDGVLYFNPGAVVGADRNEMEPPSIGKLHIAADGGISHEWCLL